jgi:hypothetical protein
MGRGTRDLAGGRWTAQRVLRPAGAVLVAFLFTGCLQGGEDDGGFDPTCPSWVLGLGGAHVHGEFANFTGHIYRRDMKEADQNGNAIPLGSNQLEFMDHPLDQMAFDFHYKTRGSGNRTVTDQIFYVQDGTVEVHAFRYDPDSPPDHTGEELPIYDEAKGPASATYGMNFSSDPERHWSMFNVTLRVNLAEPWEEPDPQGVFLDWWFFRDQDQDPETASVALLYYKAQLWYRTCGEDGTRY